ncbi:hypothetical protein SEA_SORORFAGO_74 [Mycobacterium phage SororFago]|nr:hypothetical protein SEA_SORORFAGO_74 [Mycobacterium phage SororFago]
MNEYRTTLELDPETRYSFVEMGPKPGMPHWHEQAHPGRFAFPTEKAAFRFAESHREPGRKVQVLTPDGKRFDL